MKIGSVLGFAIGLSILAGLGSPGTAAAQTCQSSCAVQVRACLQSARTKSLACRLDCRTNAAPTDLRACMHLCRDAFGSERSGCRTGVRDCVSACVPGDSHGGGPACLGDCGQKLGICAQGVVAQAKACVGDCRTADDRLACVKDCAAGAESGAQACASDFESCTTGCNASPSGAFVE